MYEKRPARTASARRLQRAAYDDADSNEHGNEYGSGAESQIYHTQHGDYDDS